MPIATVNFAMMAQWANEAEASIRRAHRFDEMDVGYEVGAPCTQNTKEPK